jgi:hypothetical protein
VLTRDELPHLGGARPGRGPRKAGGGAPARAALAVDQPCLSSRGGRPFAQQPDRSGHET